MEGRNKGLIIFGIILLVIGLIASFYESKYYEAAFQTWYSYNPPRYPFQTLGIILTVAGIVFVALGFLYSPRKTPPPPSNPRQQKTN
jgi:uncharacterized membrane protein